MKSNKKEVPNFILSEGQYFYLPNTNSENTENNNQTTGKKEEKDDVSFIPSKLDILENI